jgi:hypothetical protein
MTKFEALSFHASIIVSLGKTEVTGNLFAEGIRLDQVQASYVYGTKMRIERLTLKKDSITGIAGDSIYIGDLSSSPGRGLTDFRGDQIFVRRLDHFAGYIFEENDRPGEIMIGLLTENADVVFQTLPDTKIKIYACQNAKRLPSNVEIVHRNLPIAAVSDKALDAFFAESLTFRQLFQTQSIGSVEWLSRIGQYGERLSFLDEPSKKNPRLPRGQVNYSGRRVSTGDRRTYAGACVAGESNGSEWGQVNCWPF